VISVSVIVLTVAETFICGL